MPLFVEELTKSILESDELIEESDRYLLSGTLSDTVVPTTLHDSLMARLDRLGAVKEVAQAASIIGREFDEELLGAVSPLDEARLSAALSKLVDSGLILRSSRADRHRYIFKHALVQNAAYGSLLTSKLRDLHLRFANALQNRLSGRAESEPELLAYHFTQANALEMACKYWTQAGQRAVEQSSNAEAVNHFAKALETLLTLPPSVDRDRIELEIQLASIKPLMNTSAKGFGSEEAHVASARARELCRILGETQKLSAVLFTEAVGRLGTGEYQVTKELGIELAHLGKRNHDGLSEAAGFGQQAWGAIGLGEFSLAHSSSDRLLALYDPRLHTAHPAYAIDQRPNGLSSKAVAMWFLGFPDQSATTMKESISYARTVNDDPTLAWALQQGTWTASFGRDAALAQTLSTEVVELAENQRSPLDLAWAQIFGGWAMGKRGELNS